MTGQAVRVAALSQVAVVPRTRTLAPVTRLLPALATAALLLSACPGDPAQRGARSSIDGVQLSGRSEGAQVAVSDGEPEVLYGDCDPGDGPDTDLCMEAFTIDGAPFGLVIETPEALTEGATLAVRSRPCDGCVVVELRRGTRRTLMSAGQLEVLRASDRYAARFTLRRPPDTALSGTFDVVPPATP